MIVKKSSFLRIISFAIVVIFLIVSISYLKFIINYTPANNAETNINSILGEVDTSEDGESNYKEESIPQNPSYTKPTYSYDILNYAYAQLLNEENVEFTTTSTSGKLGFGQNIKLIAKKSKNYMVEETFTYGNAPFLKSYYEKLTCDENKVCTLITTSKIDADYNYDLSGSKEETYSLDYVHNNIRSSAFEIVTIIPSKSVGIITSFDKISNSNYMIIKFSFNNFPSKYIEDYKKLTGSTDLQIHSLTYTIYIEKSTYRIKEYDKVENFSMTVSTLGYINLTLTAQCKFQYPKTVLFD